MKKNCDGYKKLFPSGICKIKYDYKNNADVELNFNPINLGDISNLLVYVENQLKEKGNKLITKILTNIDNINIEFSKSGSLSFSFNYNDISLYVSDDFYIKFYSNNSSHKFHCDEFIYEKLFNKLNELYNEKQLKFLEEYLTNIEKL